MAARLLAIVLVVVFVSAPVPAGAAQDDARLDGLFARLQATGEAHEGARLAGRIWAIWLESGEAAIDALMREGQALMVRRLHALARGRFDEIVARAPDFAEGWNKRATVLFLMDDYNASIRDIGRTLALEPRHFGALSGLGLVYTALGEERAALRAFRKALEVNPHMPGVRGNIEALEKSLGDRKI